ncbi:TFIIB-type zinc finger domain-containing protein [Aspergillus chevalieri]|uniref:Pol I core factor CF n=1 Tax=Aspergillus chevalieri TaxID=182096 RepID=A0A7R7VGC6_ASPCH|nr:Pol I core factor CF [Aspergillus chevalieri]BCR84176.1 Pol I core factor CF [Aspergillus chevalieri]
MEYTITRGVCGQEGCRERRYYLDNGLWFCRRGHQQEGRQVEEDPEDYGVQGRTHRVKKDVVEKSQKTYRGQRAYSLFLQIYQLILWKQSHALVHDRGFPAQFENVIRDLWALRLEGFSSKINTNMSETETEEPEVFSSQAADTDDESDKAFKPSGKRVQWPRLVDSIALCYMGALLMRLPIGIADFHRMVMQGDVPYLRIIKTIPREMRDKLSPEYLSLFETTRLPKAEHFHKAALELILFYHRRSGVHFPPLNAPLLLFRFIKRLTLPIDIYPAVTQLQKLVGFTFTYPPTIAGKRRSLHLPEVQMMTLIVISTKLLFPFDDVKRYPESARDPSTQAIDWQLWAQVQRHFDNREKSSGRIGKGNEVLVNEKDVFSMTPNQLDEYLDWYEKSWLDSSKGANSLADLFPLGPTGAESQPTAPPSEADDEASLDSMLETVTRQLKTMKVVADPESEVPRPGSFYPRYRLDTDLPETVRPFYETAAKVVGIPLSTLVKTVFQTEVRMGHWQEDRRRMEYYGEVMDMEFPGDADVDDIEEAGEIDE